MGEVKTRILLFALLLLVAAQIEPQQITIQGGEGVSFSEILTVTNTLTRPAEFTLQLSDFSQYLSDAVNVRQETVSLMPQESKNFQIQGVVPALGPEVHKLTYEVREGSELRAESTIRIPIQGNQNFEVGMQAQAQDIANTQALEVPVELSNFGNIIGYFILKLHIQEQGVRVGQLEYPQAIQVLPGEQQEITLVYTDSLEPGNYDVVVSADVNAGEQLLEERIPVRVTLDSTQKTIRQGEDLQVTLKRYNTAPRISYVVAKQGEIQLQEVFVAQEDAITIPTGNLQVGKYQVQLTIESNEQSERQTFALDIQERQLLPAWVIPVLLLSGIGAFVLRKNTRNAFHIWFLERQIRKREKRLNTLIKRAHTIEEKL